MELGGRRQGRGGEELPLERRILGRVVHLAWTVMRGWRRRSRDEAELISHSVNPPPRPTHSIPSRSPSLSPNTALTPLRMATHHFRPPPVYSFSRASFSFLRSFNLLRTLNPPSSASAAPCVRLLLHRCSQCLCRLHKAPSHSHYRMRGLRGSRASHGGHFSSGHGPGPGSAAVWTPLPSQSNNQAPRNSSRSYHPQYDSQSSKPQPQTLPNLSVRSLRRMSPGPPTRCTHLPPYRSP